MSPVIGYYAHHHGSGHLHRALLVAGASAGPVDIVSSIDHPAVDVRLPLDVEDDHRALGEPHGAPGSPAVVHWAPRHSPALAERTAVIVDWVRRRRPALVVVDVSVEVTLLLHLLGVPVVVVRQHGDRTDPPHQLAYDAAASLLAPYPRWAEDRTASEAMRAKTTYVGGFSRFDGRGTPPARRDPEETVVMIGTGGSSLDVAAVQLLASHVGGRWTVLGAEGPSRPGIRFLGTVEDPWPHLRTAGVLVTSAGHSALSEAAAADIATIAVAEPRPFDEQRHKVAVLAGFGAVHAAPPLDHPREWAQAIAAARRTRPTWQQFSDGRGLERTVDHLAALATELGPRAQHGSAAVGAVTGQA